MVERLIHGVLMESLNEKQYSQEQSKTWTEQIGDAIKTKLKGGHCCQLIEGLHLMSFTRLHVKLLFLNMPYFCQFLRTHTIAMYVYM